MAKKVMIGNVVLGKKPVIVLSSNGRTMIPGGKRLTRNSVSHRA